MKTPPPTKSDVESSSSEAIGIFFSELKKRPVAGFSAGLIDAALAEMRSHINDPRFIYLYLFYYLILKREILDSRTEALAFVY